MKNFLAVVATSAFASLGLFAQAADTPYQVRHFANIQIGDAVINATNTGASSTVSSPQNGDLCANYYVLNATDATLLSCCSCLVKANTVQSLNLLDLLGVAPPTNSAIVKMMATVAAAGSCNAATVAIGANVLATGLDVWGSHARLVRAYPGAVPTTAVYHETAFTPSTLSAAELTALNAKCTAKSASPGICAACRAGVQ